MPPWLFPILAFGCDPDTDPMVIDSQTNWLSICEIDAQCGALHCVCGVCTNPCNKDADCTKTKGSVCLSSTDVGAIAQCGGGPATAPGLCMPRCDDGRCARGQMCVASVCTPVPIAAAHVRVDTGAHQQVLTGFGATVAYSEGDITTHPKKDALYQAVFADLGLDVLRLRNRYGHVGDDDLTSAKELVTQATKSLGRSPKIFMTSWSPPATLKANGAELCSGNPDTCTLKKTAAGAFDYAAFAAYWRGALDAYTMAGVVPDYVGLQNNADWVPASSVMGEACKFLPVEGTAPALVGSTTQMVKYPGLAEAQAATVAAFAGAASVPKIMAPESSDTASVAAYVAALDSSTLGAVSHHLYGTNPQAPDLSSLQSVGKLARQDGVPVFQTEADADGFGTALLIQYTATVENASAYVQSSLTSSAIGPGTDPGALVGLTASDFTLEDPYYSVRHFARYTDPGWVRVDASSSVQTLLASAWQSPGADALTIVLVNTSASEVDAELALAEGSWPGTSRVTRTVFGGSERAADLGSLSSQDVLRVPGRSIVTVAFSK
jgi:glucuronoarabinoxylan endo-1,4-beta-xylanase